MSCRHSRPQVCLHWDRHIGELCRCTACTRLFIRPQRDRPTTRSLSDPQKDRVKSVDKELIQSSDSKDSLVLPPHRSPSGTCYQCGGPQDRHHLLLHSRLHPRPWPGSDHMLETPTKWLALWAAKPILGLQLA